MVTRRRSLLLFVLALTIGTAARADAQPPTLGIGKIEIGGFPMGGTFFTGGDGNQEVDFNVYSAGGNVTFYPTDRVGIEGEVSIGLGLAQDVRFRNQDVLHVQMPNVWGYFGNVIYFPSGGTGRHVPFYVTGGIGAVSLQSRQPTKPFGYDIDTTGFQTFLAENIGGGVKIFRAEVPDWGFRADYRYLFVNANSDAPAFFARSKGRGGHRVNFGIFFTWKR